MVELLGEHEDEPLHDPDLPLHVRRPPLHDWIPPSESGEVEMVMPPSVEKVEGPEVWMDSPALSPCPHLVVVVDWVNETLVPPPALDQVGGLPDCPVRVEDLLVGLEDLQVGLVLSLRPEPSSEAGRAFSGSDLKTPQQMFVLTQAEEAGDLQEEGSPLYPARPEAQCPRLQCSPSAHDC